MRDLCTIVEVSIFGVQSIDISFPEKMNDDEEFQDLLDELNSPEPEMVLVSHRTMWD